MFYRKIILPIISRLNPKNVRTLAYRSLNLLNRFSLTRHILKLLYFRSNTALRREVFGLTFANPLGLGSGFDRNAEYCDIISSIGFGFVEIGPLTVSPERNPAIENKGVLAAIQNLKSVRTSAIIAADIAYNSATAEEEIGAQMEKALAMLYDFVDVFVINATISDGMQRSPLEDPETLEDAMDVVLDGRLGMDSMKPVLVKLLPDIPKDQLDSILDYCMLSGVEGIVAGDAGSRHNNQFRKNIDFIRYIHDYTKGRLEIIGCGGLIRQEQAYEMLSAGASLVEFYTGIFLEGPRIVRRTLKYLESKEINKAKTHD